MWKKNRENNSNKKSGGGVPFFNVFSRKKIASLMMAGVMIATPIMLAGCSDGKDGANGADGTMWYTGTEQPEESQGKIGDFFYDKATSTIYIKTENGWESQGSIKGATGSQGEQGDTGAKGDKGDKGDKGNTGATGEDGATWLTGTDISGTGTSIQATIANSKVGDLYFNTTTCDVYTCTETNTWKWLANIKGTTGDSADNMEMQVSSGKIQWRYKTGTDTTWKDLIAVSDLKGATGDNGYTPYIQDGYWYINNTSTGIKAQGEQGNAGKKVEIQKTDTAIQWKYDEDAEWQTLVELSALKGATGDNGKSVKIAVNDNNIQWRYTDDSNDWQTIIAVDTLKGSKGEDGTTPHIDTKTGNWFIGETNTGVKAAGTDGREIKLNVTTDYIQWKYDDEDSTWTNLIPLSSLKGADGATWHKGTTLTTTNLTGDVAGAKNGDFYLNTSTYDIFQMENNAWTHIGNIKGEKGDTGNGIASITVSGPAEDGLTYTYTIKFTDTSVADYVFTVKNGAKGDTGATGATGATGNGIASITIDTDSTKTNDSQTTYIINFTDNTTYSFVVKNGTNGTNGNDGVSITGIEKTSSSGNVDTYTITYSNNTSSTFTVTNGTDGKDGATWLTGTAVGGTTQGSADTVIGDTPVDGAKVGDLYFNTNTCDVYTCTAENTWKWLANIKGNKGADGTTPTITISSDGYWEINGTKTTTLAKGTDGTTPTITINDDGYWVINGETTSTSAKAINGTNGADGATWLTGEEDPTDTQGKNGDMYLNTKTYNVFKKANDTWGTAIANLKGATGAQGEQGEKGDKGDTGSAGATWLTATTDPTNDTIANENDLYLNTTSGNIFKKTSTGWDNIGNIKGAKGDTGSQGETGNAGATWLTGTAITGTGENIPATITGSKVGDLYFNTNTCDVYTCTAENTWKWLANIKGSKGEDGTSVYVGYDGYIWCGTTKTEYKAQIDSTTTDASVWEDTIAVANANGMGKYFGHEYVDMSKNIIALMSYYKVHAQMTIYGNSEITEIQFISENAGKLDIGTAKVSDIAHAGATVESLNTETTKTTSYNVVEGLNTITFDTPLVIAEDETLILGGSNSTAKLYVAKDIPLDDEYGNFTRIDGTKQDVISKTGTSSYVDTLAVRVKANACTYAEEAVLDSGLVTAVNEKYIANVAVAGRKNSTTTEISGNNGGASFPILVNTFANNTATAIYQGKKITRMGFLLGEGAGNDTTTKVWVYRFKKTNITNNILYFGNEKSENSGLYVENADNYVKRYELTFTDIKKNSAGSKITADSWTYTDCNIVVGEDELLGFIAGSSNLMLIDGTISPNTYPYTYYEADCDNGGGYKYYTSISQGSFAVDMYYKDKTEYTFEQHLASLEAKNNPSPTGSEKATAISSYTKGKNISILGDSLSTFAGYSNDSTNTNSMIGDNISTYGVGITGIDVTSVDQTWWKQTADMTGMNVLVNNSSSGSMVTKDNVCDKVTSKSGLTRCEYLDDNTGDNSGTTPDIIAVNMGINDMLNGVGVATFEDKYTLMIQKIKAKYKDAKIFVFTLPKVLDEAATKANNGTATFVSDTLLESYNTAIKEVGESEGCTVVEVYPNYSWTADNWETYCTSGDAYGHPLAKGMDLITNAFIDTLYETYVDASSNSGDSTTSNTSSDASIAENTESTTTNTNDTTTNTNDTTTNE